MPQFKNAHARPAKDVWPSVLSEQSMRRIAADGAAPSTEDLRPLFRARSGGSGTRSALNRLSLTRKSDEDRSRHFFAFDSFTSLSHDQWNLLREYRWHPPLQLPSAKDWTGDIKTDRSKTHQVPPQLLVGGRHYGERGFVCDAARHHATSLVVCGASARGKIEDVGGEILDLESPSANPRFLTDVESLVRIARGKLDSAAGSTIVQRVDAACAGR